MGRGGTRCDSVKERGVADRGQRWRRTEDLRPHPLRIARGRASPVHKVAHAIVEDSLREDAVRSMTRAHSLVASRRRLRPTLRPRPLALIGTRAEAGRGGHVLWCSRLGHRRRLICGGPAPLRRAEAGLVDDRGLGNVPAQGVAFLFLFCLLTAHGVAFAAPLRAPPLRARRPREVLIREHPFIFWLATWHTDRSVDLRAQTYDHPHRSTHLPSRPACPQPCTRTWSPATGLAWPPLQRSPGLTD